MKAIIEVDIPDYQLGQEVSIYFKDTMMIKGIVQEPKTGWIPVSERLPLDYEIVIASCDGIIYPEAQYSKADGWEWAYESGAGYWEELEGVDAWQPLPKPYRSEVSK